MNRPLRALVKLLLLGLPVGLTLCSVLLLPGCGGDTNNNPDILCTTTVVADVVRQVAGEHQSVDVLMGADVDPHTYDPTPADARRLRGAKVVFYSGLHLEGKMIEMLEDVGRKKPVVAIAEQLDRQRILKDKNGTVDPHAWFDLALWSGTADAVAETLAEYDRQHADEYRANARTYKDKLLAAHEEFKKELASIPEAGRVLVTAHDAFHYFGKAYRVEVLAIQGISTDSEAGVREINKLVDTITRRGIKAIFVETSVSDKNILALKEGCESKGHTVEIGGTLYSDALGEPGSDTGTLVGATRHNVETIVKALK